MTPHILGLVTETTGSFLCTICHETITMISIIDRRDPKSRIWREAEPHTCEVMRLARIALARLPSIEPKSGS